MTEQEKAELSVTGPGGTGFKLAGARIEVITAFMTLVMVTLLGYALWEHKADAAIQNNTLRDAIKEMTQVQKQGVEAQRELNCLIVYRGSNTTPAEVAEFCKRVSR